VSGLSNLRYCEVGVKRERKAFVNRQKSANSL